LEALYRMRSRHIWTTFLLLLALQLTATAQEGLKWSILVGAHGRTRSSVELGIMHAMWVDRHAYAVTGFSASAEWIPGPNMLAPQIAAFIEVEGMLAIGLNVIYVTDFEQGSFIVRPEVGVGVFIGRLVYGYNIGSDSEVGAYGIGRHEISLKVHIGAW
jgi:hypothetical protein